MILLKLGGSIITNKDKPLTPRKRAICNITEALKKIDEPLVLVHGGGSYGHYWSVIHDMHTKPERYNMHGVATVKNSMVQLNNIVLDILLKSGLHPYCLPPAGFMRGSRPVPEAVREMAAIAKSGLVPVTFGDALWHGRNKTYILSGDRIMTHLAKLLSPRLCIFALNEDGLYGNPDSKDLIREFAGNMHSTTKNSMDVTGGMARKVKEARMISKNGTAVFFVNGNRPERIADAAKGKFYGTLFREGENA